LFFNRTFHPDEANQAFTTGRLLETGVYEYRPQDHHGPTLYYAAAPLQKAFGHHDTASIDGSLLRCTPLLFAVLAIVFSLFAVRKATRSWLPALFSATLLAATPIFAFYSTDFIQEMLLAAFTTMMLWAVVNYLARARVSSEAKTGHSTKTKPGTYALFFGIAAGLAFATKETSVLSFAAAAVAAVCVILLPANKTTVPPTRWPRFVAAARRDAILAAAGFTLTSILLFSAFCTDWTGVYNAFIAAPLSYFHRAAGDAGAGGANWHVHPWWWYAKTLFFPNRICYSLIFLPLIVYPLLPRFRKSKPLVFLAVHSFVLFALYSILPYKTPWCMLQVAVPLVVAYGILLGEIAVNLRHGRAIAAIAFILPFSLFVFANSQIMRDPDSRDIPYNYAHASPQVKDLAACVAEKFTAAKRPASNLQSTTNNFQLIAVALPPCDTWPFPWYNRPLESHTGYWTDFSDLENLSKKGVKPTIVVCPAEEGHLVMPLFPHLNRTRRFEMRPRVRIRVFWSEP